MDLPLEMVSGKGKEKEQPRVKIGLKWAGRQVRVQKAGLPITPPGKMFRTDYSGIPMSPEQRANLRRGLSA